MLDIYAWHVSDCQIRRLEDDRDAVFSVSPSEGVIPPEDEVVITTTYSPVSTGTFSRDHYEIVTTGGNKVRPGNLRAPTTHREKCCGIVRR